jgi:hypothetical protein
MSARDSGISLDPIDQLIRELLDRRRTAIVAEIESILNHIRSAPFDARVVLVPPREQGLTYSGQILGTHVSADVLHLVRRVLVDRQWRTGTTMSEYLGDLHAAAANPAVRLALYRRRGGAIALVVAPNAIEPARLGQAPEALIVVVYSADWGMIVTGYQASSIGTISVPGDALWLT